MKLLHITRRLTSRRAKVALAWISLCLFAAIFAPFLANDLPLYARYHGDSYFPALHGSQQLPASGPGETMRAADKDWKHAEDGVIIFPLITYSPASTDLQNTGFISPLGSQRFQQDTAAVSMPLRYRHWLGTTQTGNDVLSGIVHGARVSLGIGLSSMLVAGLIGFLIGGWCGYAGDRGHRIQHTVFWTMIAGILPAWFFGFTLRADALQQAFYAGPGSLLVAFGVSIVFFAFVMALFWAVGKGIGRIPFLSAKFFLPVDMLLSRITEIFTTLPRWVLIITLSALTRPSLFNLVLIFGLTGWSDIARLVRAEMLKIRSSDYLVAAAGQGLSTSRIVLRHALPNVIQPALASVMMGIAGIILVESSLSFLGIGVPFDTVTWGSLIAAGRENFDAWWVVVFPGLAIFFTLASLNILADEFNKKH